MKASLKICLLYLLTLAPFYLLGQCSISNVQISNSACAEGSYGLTIDFDYGNNSTNFYLKTPYTTHIFPYSALPVSIGDIPGYCSGSFDIEIYDLLPGNNLNPDCFEIIPLNYQCCNELECGLEFYSIDWNCGNNSFDLFVNFKEFGCLQNSSYDISVTKLDLFQNVVEVYNYGPFNYEASFNSKVVNIPQAPDCDYLYRIKVEDNTTGTFFEVAKNLYCCECAIAEFTASIDTGSCENGEVTVDFNFVGYTFESNSYIISDGSNIWEFNENSAQQFTMPAYCQGEVNLTATMTAAGCSETFLLPSVCCDCEINNIGASDPVCEDSTFSFLVNIDVDGSCVYSVWTAEVEGNIYPLVASGSDFLVSGIYSEDSITTINFCTQAQSLICYPIEVVNPCYSPTNPPDPCSITSFVAWQDTVCNNGQAVIRFDYNANNTFGSDGYYVVVDSNSFFFESNDEKTINYPAYCNNDVIVLIYDVNEPTCNLSDTLSPLCCACEVDSIYINSSSCDSGLFNITLAFEGLTGSCQYVSWTVEVSDSIYQATIINNSWAVTGISSLDTIITYEICTFLGECYTTTGLNPCFDTTTVTPLPCQLDSFHVFTLYDCNEGFITNGFTIQGSNFGSNGYFITDGLNVYHFENNEPQEFSSFGSCTGDLIITLYDATDSLCTLTDTINPCCECLIDSFFVSAVCDTNDLISINLELFDVEGYCALNGWTVTVNNVTYPMFINNDSIYVALNINSQDTIMNLTFCTKTGQQHCFTSNKVNPCLIPTNLSCKMSNADIEIFDQNGITAKIAIENNNNCGVNYNIWADNIDHGIFTAFENIVYVPLNVGNIPVIDFKICSVEPNIDCIGEQVVNPYFTNQVADELSEISINYNEGGWEIVNPNNISAEFILYNTLGQLVFKRSIMAGSNAFHYKPEVTGIYMALLQSKSKNKNKAVFIR